MKAGIVLAGGSGHRFGVALPKQFIDLSGFPVIQYSIVKFLHTVDIVALVCHPNYFEEVLKRMDLPRSVLLVSGGKNRQLSVWSGLVALQKFQPTVVAVHDGARPLFSTNLLSQTLDSAQSQGSGIAAVPLTQTVCNVKESRVTNYIPRETLRVIQTPQSFLYKALFESHQNYPSANASDDSQLFMAHGQPVFVVKGEETNLKITYPSDIDLAANLLKNHPELGI